MTDVNEAFENPEEPLDRLARRLVRLPGIWWVSMGDGTLNVTVDSDAAAERVRAEAPGVEVRVRSR